LFENNLIPTWFGKLKVLEQEKAVIVQIANAALARRLSGFCIEQIFTHQFLLNFYPG
jgi:hypothetical protein